MEKIIVPGLSVPRYQFKDPVIGDLAALAEELGARMALTYLAAAYASNMLGQITTTGLFMGINNGSPSNTGANEIIGSLMSGYSSGGYTGKRMAVTWGSVTNGVVSSTDTQTFPLLAIQAGGIGYWSLWTADGSGASTYLFGGATSGLSGSIPSGANVTFTNAITLTQAG